MEARASGSRYALEGPEREPNYLNGTPHLTWTLRSLDGKEWLISYLACAADTLRPECMVFKSKRGRVTDWREVAVSYAEDPNEALEEVLHDMGAEDVAVAVNLSAKKEEKMADKSNCPSWAEGVPVPMDMDGNVVPLATRKLYDGTGREVEVREIALVDSKLDRGLVWRVKTPGGVVMVLDRLRLAHSDSLEKLLEDLDRAAGMYGSTTCACSYLTGSARTECSECKCYEKDRWCTQIMVADVARRIRALRKADENAD